VSSGLALNGVVAVAGLYLAFALFPAPGVAATEPAPDTQGDTVQRTRDAAVAVLVMLPPFALLLAFDATSAMRILFTVAIVLVSLNRRDVRETGVESVLSAVMAGAAALAFGVLNSIWPTPGAALLAMALLGLLVVPYAFEGRQVRSLWPCRWSGCCSARRRTPPRRRRWSGAFIR